MRSFASSDGDSMDGPVIGGGGSSSSRSGSSSSGSTSASSKKVDESSKLITRLVFFWRLQVMSFATSNGDSMGGPLIGGGSSNSKMIVTSYTWYRRSQYVVDMVEKSFHLIKSKSTAAV
jgi:hypothetical protein